MLPFKETGKSRENQPTRLGAVQEFSFVYVQTEMHIIHVIIHLRGAIAKHAAGNFGSKLGG